MIFYILEVILWSFCLILKFRPGPKETNCNPNPNPNQNSKYTLKVDFFNFMDANIPHYITYNASVDIV